MVKTVDGDVSGNDRKPQAEQLAAAVRDACVQVAIDAYEEAGMRGLCGDGRWEYAVGAMRRLDLAPVLAHRLRSAPE